MPLHGFQMLFHFHRSRFGSLHAQRRQIYVFNLPQFLQRSGHWCYASRFANLMGHHFAHFFITHGPARRILKHYTRMVLATHAGVIFKRNAGLLRNRIVADFHLTKYLFFRLLTCGSQLCCG